MAQHYFELASYIAIGLGGFKVLSRFAIKMIAIFGSDKFSKRAFRVLGVTQEEGTVDTADDEGDDASQPGGENVGAVGHQAEIGGNS